MGNIMNTGDSPRIHEHDKGAHNLKPLLGIKGGWSWFRYYPLNFTGVWCNRRNATLLVVGRDFGHLSCNLD